MAADRAVWYRLVGLFVFGTALCRAERRQNWVERVLAHINVRSRPTRMLEEWKGEREVETCEGANLSDVAPAFVRSQICRRLLACRWWGEFLTFQSLAIFQTQRYTLQFSQLPQTNLSIPSLMVTVPTNVICEMLDYLYLSFYLLA